MPVDSCCCDHPSAYALGDEHSGFLLTTAVFAAWQNAEIFTLTYGSMVRQLITDLEDVNDVNKQLETM